MKMRELYDRVYRRLYLTSNQRVKQMIVPWIDSAVCVDLNNVHEWSLEQKDSAIPKYLPICPQRLPFPQMWFEWGTIHTDHVHPVGCLAQEVALDDEPIGMVNFTIFTHDPEIDMTALVSMGQMKDNQIQTLESYKCPEVFIEQQPGLENVLFLAAMATVIPALVFFSCRNIELRRIERSTKELKNLERKGVKPPQFHVIEIHKTTVRNVYEQGISNGQIVRHACMVRGHTKHYTEDKKLFGKIAGNWFWESHARGSIGTPTVSDYRVHGPQHKGDCIQ